jgi:hypothetical protein
MRIILKIIAAPLSWCFTVFAAVITFLFCVTGACVVSRVSELPCWPFVALSRGRRWADRLPCYRVPRLAIWPSGHRGLADRKLHNLNFALRVFYSGLTVGIFCPNAWAAAGHSGRLPYREEVCPRPQLTSSLIKKRRTRAPS